MGENQRRSVGWEKGYFYGQIYFTARKSNIDTWGKMMNSSKKS